MMRNNSEKKRGRSEEPLGEGFLEKMFFMVCAQRRTASLRLSEGIPIGFEKRSVQIRTPTPAGRGPPSILVFLLWRCFFFFIFFLVSSKIFFFVGSWLSKVFYGQLVIWASCQPNCQGVFFTFDFCFIDTIFKRIKTHDRTRGRGMTGKSSWP